MDDGSGEEDHRRGCEYVLSSHYQGTPYGPYAAYGEKSWKGAYRSIGVNRTDFLSVIQMRPDHKGDNGILQWIAFASNAFNVLVPSTPM